MPVPNCPRDPSGKLCLNLFVYFKVKFHLFIYFSPFCRKRPMTFLAWSFNPRGQNVYSVHAFKFSDAAIVTTCSFTR